ncbi:MAG: class I SAM-dependent methyltransferase [Chloroflexi bacterium]|nr:class I SAM-dependent methyltransferase [Chloroflexota bacterium]
MNLDVAARLIQLNRDFYDRFGADFSATRQQLQPGVTRLLPTLARDASILDLGCGNGEFARVLARNGHRGSYLGLDFSVPLLADASALPEGFDAKFVEFDLTKLSVISEQLSVISHQALNTEHWTLITAFATLHHIPSTELRLNLLKTVSTLLAPDGKFILSNWQFLNSAKLRARIQSWEQIGLSDRDVDEGDYLLDWRRGGEGLRYAHQFSEDELSELAAQTGFSVVDSFYSDGEGGNLGLYQTWMAKP